jgi:hypothetical protein
MKRVALLVVVAAGLAIVAPTAVQAAKNPCAEHGYLNYTRTDGSTFRSTGECTVYVNRGGTLVPLVGPSVDVTSASLSNGLLVFSFTPGSQLTLLHYVSAPYGIDYLDPAAQVLSIAPDGTVSLLVGLTVSGSCVPGAPLAVTVSDAAGDSATGSGTIACA